VPAYIDLYQKRAVVALADTLSFESAAAILGTTAPQLRVQIRSLEKELCLHIFAPDSEVPSLTEDGHRLVELFRQAISRRTS